MVWCPALRCISFDIAALDHCSEFFFGQDRDSQLCRLLQLAAGMYMSGNLTAVEATILFPACITMGTLIGHFARIVLVCKVRALYYPVMFATPIIDAVIVMFLTRLVLVLMGY